MNQRNLLIWGLIVALLIGVFYVSQNSARSSISELDYTTFKGMVATGDVASATVKGDQITGTTKSNQKFTVNVPFDAADDISNQLADAGVKVNVKSILSSGGNGFLSFLGSMMPMLIILGIWLLIMRNMQGGGKGGAMGFGRSRARMLTEKHGRVTFDDVAGIDEAKEELQEVVEFLKDPSKYQRLGGKIPKGALLIGPPGTGKTLTARAVAGEANVPFFTISGSDFVEMFVGVGASRVRDMFEQAKKNAPCIIFIDEIDAVGRHRGAGWGGGNDEREQTLNQLLVEMDGFEANEGIIIIAATNRADVLDPALLRPGRFDRQVTVGLPDVKGREQILKVHMREVPIGKNVKPKVIARGTPGFTGADLANLVNEAALLAARRNKKSVSMQEFEDAKDKVLMGPERKSMVMSEQEKELTAWHEAGHAIVAINVPDTDPLHKATIMPRGRALGMVMQLPEEDKLSTNYTQMTSRLAVLMGGRIAEELKFGKDMITSGASSDIQGATQLARAMVTRWGFSDELGTIEYDPQRNEYISPETAAKVEEEVRRLIKEANDAARKIMTEKKDDWATIAEGLIEYETLSGEEVDNLLKGIKPERPDDEDTTPQGPGSAVPVTSSVPTTGDEGIGGVDPQPA